MTTRIKYPRKRTSRPLPFTGPRGFCECGHTGDGSDTQHADQTTRFAGVNKGNGRCIVPGCPCLAYTTARRTPEFDAYCTDAQGWLYRSLKEQSAGRERIAAKR